MTGVNEDELEHLHAAWLWDQGVQPFTGFFQHHPPAYWMLLRPLVAGEGKNLVDTVGSARTLSVIIIALLIGAVYWLSLRLFGKGAALLGAAFWAIYCACSMVTIHARPDMLMVLLMVAGTALAIEGFGLAVGSRRASLVRTLLGGVLLGASVCVLPKAIFWVLALAAALAAIAMRASARRGERSLLAHLGVLAGGLAIPGAIELGCVTAWGDLGQFWFCQVTANSHIANGMWDVTRAMKVAIGRPVNWAMVSAGMAAVGGAAFAASKGEGAGERKLVALAATLGGVALALMGLPWDQYHLPLLAMMAGFAGVGFACGIERIDRPWQRAAVVAMLGLAIIWPWSLDMQTKDERGKTVTSLEASLAAYQHILDTAKPGDTYLSMLNQSPVKMMDSDPKLWMHLLCFQTPDDLKGLVHTIVEKRPRFVVGFDSPFFVPHGGNDSLRLTRARLPDGKVSAWVVHSFIGQVPADEVWRWYDSIGHGVLQRRETPRPEPGAAE